MFNKSVSNEAKELQKKISDIYHDLKGGDENPTWSLC